jgi:hypothetical protein
MGNDHVGEAHEGATPARTTPAVGAWQGVVAEDGVSPPTGRPSKGCVPAGEVRIQGHAGQELAFGQRPPPGAPPVRVRGLRDIGPYRFEVCPIYLAPDPSTREHVPPRALGGTVATLVCSRCNNDLGSRVEVDLIDWRDDAVRRPRISGGTIEGPRKLERLLRRTTADGEFVLIPDGRSDAALSEIIASGEFELTLAPPDPGKYRLAALKHAYIAACLDRREIPDSATGRQIRHDLLRARDSRRDAPFPTSEYADSLPLMRSYAQPSGPPLALCLADIARPRQRPEIWILLGGTVCVPWPMPDFPPIL